MLNVLLKEISKTLSNMLVKEKIHFFFFYFLNILSIFFKV